MIPSGEGDIEYLPAAHLEQVALAAEDSRPAAQSTHLEASAVLNWPALHFLQDICLGNAWYVPGMHGRLGEIVVCVRWSTYVCVSGAL